MVFVTATQCVFSTVGNESFTMII